LYAHKTLQISMTYKSTTNSNNNNCIKKKITQSSIESNCKLYIFYFVKSNQFSFKSNQSVYVDKNNVFQCIN